MAKYKPGRYDQMVMIRVSLQNQLQPGPLELTIHERVEHHIDLSVFETRYQNDDTGATALHPKLWLKVILFAYSRGIISSRQSERACSENILFRARSGSCHPDHSTLAHFVSSRQQEIESIFSNILLVCDQLDLLGGTHFSLDGRKLPSNASKAWSGTFEELKRKQAKLQAKRHLVIPEHIHQEVLPSSEIKRRQKPLKRLQQQGQCLNVFLQEQKPKVGKSRTEVQSHVTDNQSAKMPTSHGVLQGYNAQAWVDGKHPVIVQAEAFGNQAHENLAPRLAGAKKNMQGMGKDPDYFKGRQLSADSKYYSYANLAFCQAESLDAYIPDLQFRQPDQRCTEQERFKNGIPPRRRSAEREKTFTAADFVFDNSRQGYLCPPGRLSKLPSAIEMFEPTRHPPQEFVGGGRESTAQFDRTDESQDRHAPRQTELRQPSGHR